MLLSFKYIIMKRVFFLLVVSVFMCITCTVNDETQNSVTTSRSIELQKVVGKLEKMNSQILETRGFRDWFKRVFYADACGYAWGRRRGWAWQGSLCSGGVASLIAAFWGKTISNIDNSKLQHVDYIHWDNQPVSVYRANLIGEAHNEIIVDLLIDSAEQLPMDENLVAIVSQQVESTIISCENWKLAFSEEELRITNDIVPVEYRSELIEFSTLMAEQSELQSLHDMAVSEIPEAEDELDLLKEYVIQIDYLDDNVSIDKFTEQLYQEINNLDLTSEDVEYLQTVLSIAKNSHKLWTEIQK